MKHYLYHEVGGPRLYKCATVRTQCQSPQIISFQRWCSASGRRIYLPLKYKSLGLDARRSIWDSFLRKVIVNERGACYSRKDLDFLAEKDLNGRQVGFPTAVRTILILNGRVLRSKTLYPRLTLRQLERDVGNNVSSRGSHRRRRGL